MNYLKLYENFIIEKLEWTENMLQVEADKYKSRREFQAHNIFAYIVAVKKNLIDDLFKNHPNKGYIGKRRKNR